MISVLPTPATSDINLGLFLATTDDTHLVTGPALKTVFVPHWESLRLSPRRTSRLWRGHPFPIPLPLASFGGSVLDAFGVSFGEYPPLFFSNTPLQVGLGPGHIALHWDPALPQKGHTPSFQPMAVVDKRLYGPRCHLVRI